MTSAYRRHGLDWPARLHRAALTSACCACAVVVLALIGHAASGWLAGPSSTPVTVDVTAQPGDTCWSLAARHVPESADTDLRQVVDGMGECSNLQPGDELTITFRP